VLVDVTKERRDNELKLQPEAASSDRTGFYLNFLPTSSKFANFSIKSCAEWLADDDSLRRSCVSYCWNFAITIAGITIQETQATS
jgi:hypothetical protein